MYDVKKQKRRKTDVKLTSLSVNKKEKKAKKKKLTEVHKIEFMYETER